MSSVTLLPQELSGTQEWGGVLELPSTMRGLEKESRSPTNKRESAYRTTEFHWLRRRGRFLGGLDLIEAGEQSGMVILPVGANPLIQNVSKYI